MKILLVAINAKYIHSNLAVYSLRAYTKDCENTVKIANFTINNLTEDIVRGIYEESPDVVAFSTYIWNVEYVKKVAWQIKQVMPQAKIWLGGPEVSYEPENFMRENPWADILMLLEGEETFRELVENKIPCAYIKGIVYRNGEDIIKNPYREPMDIDRLVFPYEDLGEFENRIIYYESSRGCPFSCSYCLSSIEKSVRFKSLDIVKREIKFFIDNKVPQVKFVDRTFNCSHARTKELWKFITDNDNGITNFHFEISADLMDDEEIELISHMREGLIQLEIGVQSTYEPTIKEIRRTMRLERLYEVVRRINTFGNTLLHLDLIAGLPYEGIETFKKSFNDVYALKPSELQLGFLKVLKGSYMHEKADEYGIKYTLSPPYEVLSTRWLSYADILILKRIEDVVENYYNSGQYKHTVSYLETLFDTPYELYEAVSQYYTKNSLWGVNHSRTARYEILYDFGISVGADALVLSQLMTYDMYLRERLKKRPSFAKDISPYKSEIRSLYDSEAAEFKDRLSHIEPVFADVKTFEVLEEPCYILFDYEHKDRINNEAAIRKYELKPLKDTEKNE